MTTTITTTTAEMPLSSQQEENTTGQSSSSRLEQDWAEEDEDLLQACLRYDPWNDFVQSIQEKAAKRKWSGGECGLFLAFCLFMSSAMLRLKAR
jgi:hypothetical protein